MVGPVGSDADKVEVAEIFDDERRRNRRDADDGACRQIDSWEIGSADATVARSGKKIRKAQGRLRWVTKAVTGNTARNRNALDAEVVGVDQDSAVRFNDGLHLPCPCDELGGLERFFDVEFARTAVVVHAVCEIAVLLRFQQDRPRPDGVDSARIDEDEIACRDGEHVEARLKSSIVNFALDLGDRDPGLEADSDLGAGLCGKSIPALGFASRLAVFLRHFVVGMHLNAELVVGKKNLDEQRRLGRRRASAKQRCWELGKERVQSFTGLWACGNEAHVAGKPDFADWIGARLDDAIKPWTQIARSPNAGVKFRIDAKGSKGAGGLRGSHEIWIGPLGKHGCG